MNRRDSFKTMCLGALGFLIGKDLDASTDFSDIPKEKLRTCEVRSNGAWIEIDFENLKKGNMFRLFDPGRKLVLDPGQNNYGRNIALSDAYKKAGVWTVNSIPYINLDNFLKENSKGVT